MGEILTTWTTWVLLLVLVVAFVGVLVLGFWLWRKRQRGASREEMLHELEQIAARLQLDAVWQTGLFEADVHGLRGEVRGFIVEAELWERIGEDFFRLSVRFPRPLRQGLKVQTRRRSWVEAILPSDELEVGDQKFDEAFFVYGDRESQSQVEEFLNYALRHRLLDLHRRAARVELGEKGLFVFLEGEQKLQDLEGMIRDALRTSLEAYNQAIEAGPSRTATHTQYEMVAVDALGRRTGEFPQGSGLVPGGASSEELRASEPTEELRGSSDSSETS